MNCLWVSLEAYSCLSCKIIITVLNYENLSDISIAVQILMIPSGTFSNSGACMTPGASINLDITLGLSEDSESVDP